MSNNVFNLYSIDFSMQLFGTWPAKLPRFIYTFLSVVVTIVVACVGYNSLNDIISNSGAVIGYWSIVYFVLIFEESVIFRPVRGYGLTGWNAPRTLSMGIAAILSFCFGVVGAVVGTGQTLYTGPVAAMIGDYGGDIGTWLAFSFAAIVYAGMRYIEVRRFYR
ncbi:hypothetical protein AA0116_g1874 [Alternaria tenuissima]|nr:hypothetical protein AA0116_g1874 [Alternaria tenuissima]